jgi:hypothetical protein
VSAYPKQPRIVDARAGMVKVYQRERRCRVCGATNVSRHHLVGKGQLGDDVAENIVPLCGDGVRGCHGAVTDGHERLGADLVLRDGDAVRRALRATMTADEVAYVIGKKGEGWLDLYYPREG